LEPFQSYLKDYLSAIREAKNKGASHDYLRQVFIEFARKSFRVDTTDVELEKGIKGTKLRGSVDESIHHLWLSGGTAKRPQDSRIRGGLLP
jgi:hypothetical protein